MNKIECKKLMNKIISKINSKKNLKINLSCKSMIFIMNKYTINNKIMVFKNNLTIYKVKNTLKK